MGKEKFNRKLKIHPKLKNVFKNKKTKENVTKYNTHTAFAQENYNITSEILQPRKLLGSSIAEFQNDLAEEVNLSMLYEKIINIENVMWQLIEFNSKNKNFKNQKAKSKKSWCKKFCCCCCCCWSCCKDKSERIPKSGSVTLLMIANKVENIESMMPNIIAVCKKRPKKRSFYLKCCRCLFCCWLCRTNSIEYIVKPKRRGPRGCKRLCWYLFCCCCCRKKSSKYKGDPQQITLIVLYQKIENIENVLNQLVILNNQFLTKDKSLCGKFCCCCNCNDHSSKTSKDDFQHFDYERYNINPQHCRHSVTTNSPWPYSPSINSFPPLLDNKTYESDFNDLKQEIIKNADKINIVSNQIQDLKSLILQQKRIPEIQFGINNISNANNNQNDEETIRCPQCRHRCLFCLKCFEMDENEFKQLKNMQRDKPFFKIWKEFVYNDNFF